jgi:hypothetical protein
MSRDELIARDANGHSWIIVRFQADDESQCRWCGCQSDEADADRTCAASLRAKAGGGQ